MKLSVVIPTCNRQERLLSLLGDLSRSTLLPLEVLVIDASDVKLDSAELARFVGLNIRHIESSVKSVCVQRNVGIRSARGEWVFLCDDDIEVPHDYISRLAKHAEDHPEAGAISGIVLEKEGAGWRGTWPVTSCWELLWAHAFGLSMWGEIFARGPVIDGIVNGYRRRGNHISSAGWPVVIDFSGTHFRTPIYGLGASIIRREWLLESPYDERLDPHGIGDNYGVALGFPAEGIHVVTDVAVRHHKSQVNRLADPRAFARRLLALHYFIKSRKERMPHVHESRFIWSLLGQVAFHTLKRNRPYAQAALESLVTVILGKNPLCARP